MLKRGHQIPNRLQVNLRCGLCHRSNLQR
jgi:hypothetical protein